MAGKGMASSLLQFLLLRNVGRLQSAIQINYMITVSCVKMPFGVTLKKIRGRLMWQYILTIAFSLKWTASNQGPQKDLIMKQIMSPQKHKFILSTFSWYS